MERAETSDRRMLRSPGTREEWRRAADAAAALLVLDAIPELSPWRDVRVDRERCEDVLARASERGIEPRASALGRYLAERSNLGAAIDPARDLAGLPPR